MIASVVVDASVAVQWLIPESTSPQALLILQRVPYIASPDLVYAEVGNAIWKRVQRGEISPSLGKQLVKEFLYIPIECHPAKELLPQAWEWATTIGATVYDALYITLAEKMDIPLVTADTRLYNLLKKVPLQFQVLSVSEVGLLLGRTSE